MLTAGDSFHLVFRAADSNTGKARVCYLWHEEEGAPADGVDLAPRRVDVTVDLKAGRETATVWTNDLTHAYVHENSAYSS